jgi:hypothetical protein
MNETSGSATVMTMEETIEYWLEYGMDLPITHEFALPLVPACIKAIDEVNLYNIDTLIELPKGVSITWMDTGERTNLCPAYAIVYRFQLTNWLRTDWDIEKHNAQIEKENSEIPNLE